MHYAWFVWSLLLLVPWGIIYVSLDSKEKKREMLMVSMWTTLFGFTEPLQKSRKSIEITNYIPAMDVLHRSPQKRLANHH